MGNTLTLLGTGTCQIESNRRASSVLLRLGGLPILFDCGHGIVQRLLDVGIIPNELEHVVISHFHPDHVSDLVPLMQAGAWSPRNPRNRDLHLYGPPGIKSLIDKLFDLYGANAFQKMTYRIHVHELQAGSFEIEGWQFESVSLPPAGNHGLCLRLAGKRYILTGDSNYHKQERACLMDSELAVIDAGHITDEEIVQLACETQVNTLICSHLYRELDEQKLQRQAESCGYRGRLIVGCDLMEFGI
ncbi:MAG TPA: ribonuclease Z [Ktedonobacteraceae bacterium]|nr:ribonuclease Z [Ktedonobacteraceae bacterium]